MSTELSVTAQNWLKGIEDKCQRQGRVLVKAPKMLKELHQFCEEHDIAFSTQPPVYLDLATLQRIKAVFDYSEDVSQMERRQAAQLRGGDYEKHAGIRPTEFLALVAVTDSALLESFAGPFYSASQVNMELDVTRLDLEAYSHLVVVENRDSLNDWYQYLWPESLAGALVIYRGDRGHSRACMRLKERWKLEQSAKSIVYFGDMDPKGVHIALTEQCDALLLPGEDFIDQCAKQEHFPDSHIQYMNLLSCDCPTGWQAFYQFFEQRGRGLRQQLMYQTPLLLYPAQNEKESSQA